MRLIDADDLLFTLEKEQAYLEKESLINRSFGIGDAIIDLLSAPTVDAVEVVRCKDCKWIRKAGTLMGENPEPIYGCHHTGVYVFEDGYCDVGERKEE